MAAALTLQAILLLAPGEPDELQALESVLEAALERIAPSVVTIETVGGVRAIRLPDQLRKKMTLPERPRENDRDAPKDGDGGEGEEQVPPEGKTPRFKDEWRKMLAWPGFKKAEGPTTGLILSADGYIVSSAWNFEGKPNVVTVTTAAGRTHAARLLGIDRAAGLALLKIEAEGLPVPRFLDPDEVRLGAWAFAIGRALDPKRVEVKYGVVSARNRIEGNALQTDAATSPTNYGGPLIDVEGAVYGVIVPLGARGEEANPNWYDSGIGFVTPIRDPQRLIERLGKEGVELKPAFLGVASDQDRTEPGARITKVEAGHAAEKAGLQADDIILEIDGHKVCNVFSLRFEIGRRRAGDTVKLLIQRGEEKLQKELELGARPTRAPGGKDKLPIPMPGPDGKRGKRNKDN
jgi:serine protease Do